MAENHTTLSAIDDDVSIPTNIDAVIYPSDNENLQEIFEHFCDEMRTLSNEIHRQYKQNQDGFGVVRNAENTVVVPEQSSLLEKKTRIINKLIALIKDSKANDFPRFKGEATLSIPEMMERECDSMQDAFTSLEKIKENNEEHIKLLKQLVSFTEEMIETPVESDGEDELLRRIEQEVNKDSKQCKKELETVIGTLYPDWNFMDVLRVNFVNFCIPQGAFTPSQHCSQPTYNTIHLEKADQYKLNSVLVLLENAASDGGWCEFESANEYRVVECLIELGFVEVNLSNMKQVKLKNLSIFL